MTTPTNPKDVKAVSVHYCEKKDMVIIFFTDRSQVFEKSFIRRDNPAISLPMFQFLKKHSQRDWIRDRVIIGKVVAINNAWLASIPYNIEEKKINVGAFLSVGLMVLGSIFMLVPIVWGLLVAGPYAILSSIIGGILLGVGATIPVNLE